MKRFAISILIAAFISSTAFAQQKSVTKEKVFQDKSGIIRWTDTKKELALFGANYCLPSACDYRAAGYINGDRKKMVDQDMAHFARMGWDGLRFSFWGDFENSDSLGNLVNNDHLDLMDYIILKGKERNIYFLLSPIVTYDSHWPDAMSDTVHDRGLSVYFKKNELGSNPKAIAAQQNYLRQLLNHVNPYTGLALKDEPNILFIEMINEPEHHSNDIPGSVKYINALVDAVRSTGCNKILFHNVSQDFAIAPALQQSKIQGASFGWYPSGLNSGHFLQGNYLRAVDEFPLMQMPGLKKLSRIVYEFDSPDLLTAYMYPAMARTFRTAGAQFAAMFSYDMLATAPYNLGWQTHHLNMVYTPVKAISAIIAAEVMKAVPLYKNYGAYPANTSFGPFNISYPQNKSEMLTAEKFIYANSSSTVPPNSKTLQQIIGYGSSPLVQYEGKGIYFLDKIKDGSWRLEVYPDALQLDDPFKMPSPGKLVTRTISRNWPMQLQLPDLGEVFTVNPINEKNEYSTVAKGGKFNIRPGVYILSTDKIVAALPEKLGNIPMKEFVVLNDQPAATKLVLHQQPEFVLSNPITIEADVYSAKEPEQVTLFVKAAKNWRMYPLPMHRSNGYTYTATVPTNRMKEGFLEYCIVVKDGDSIINFPSGINKTPADWDYYGSSNWTSKLVSDTTPLRLLFASEDEDQLSFTRIGDGIRSGIYSTVPASNTGEPAFHLELPLSYDKNLDDYTLSLPIKEKIQSRKNSINKAQSLVLYAKGVNQQQQAYITLMEHDGTCWTKKINLTKEWSAIKINLAELGLNKGAMLPLGYPGRWNYWSTPAAGRGTAGDHVNMTNVERIQISIRQSDLKKEAATSGSWIELTSVVLSFEK